MADGFNIYTNLPDFKRQMIGFAQDLQNKIAGSGVNAAAQAFKKRAVAVAPELQRTDTRKKNPRTAGTLKRAMYVYRRRNPQAGTVLYSVSFRKGRKEQKRKGGSRDAFYGRFLELGWIPRGPGRRLRGGSRRRALERSRILAGGGGKITKYKFLLPAFQQAQGEALAAFNRKMTDRINKASKERQR